MMSGVPGSKLSHSLEDIQDKFEEGLKVNVRFHVYTLLPFSLALLEGALWHFRSF